MIVHPCPDADKMPEAACALLARMEELLLMRKTGRMTRAKFLAAWSVLRRKLELTPEYQEFRLKVLARDRYRCGRCGRVGRIVHHRLRVARRPALALVVSNGEVRCTECHEAQHACLRRAS